MKLNLTRPLIFFDLETTGTSVTNDRIVQFGAIKVYPDGTEENTNILINPGCHIPEESTAIHHFTDADVADKPTFREIADKLLEYFEGCDIAGYNSNKFDVPLLIEEFARVGKAFDVNSHYFIDVQSIFYKMEPRTLVGAYRYYCGKELEDAHQAPNDVRATYEVLLGQFEMYGDKLDSDVKKLAEFTRMGNSVDLAGRIVLNDKGEAVFNFGKHKGHTLEEVYRREPGFFDWMLCNDFPINTKNVLLSFKTQFNAKKNR